MGLFREEALKAEKEKYLGNVIIVTPVKLKIFVIGVLVILLALLVFVVSFSYTRKQTITGQLVPNLGLIKIYSPQYGTIVSSRVNEGDFVRKGDTLYVLSSDRESFWNNQGIQEVISNEISNRLNLINEEMIKLDEQYKIDKNALESNIMQGKQQVTVLEGQLENYKKIISLVENRQKQYEALYQKNYISLEQVERVKEEYLSSVLNYNNIMREKLNTEKELSSRQSELNGLDIKYNQQKSQYERNISSINQELVESESRREIVIQAPQSGMITAVIGLVGQYFDGKRPLVSLIPEGSTLQAQLYAPSEAIGFIHEGAKVLMRYQAYPYQKFGQYEGVVESISKTAFPKMELTDLVSANEYNPNASFYRITVKLDKQSIYAYGENVPLQAGMLLDADIVLDKRKLYEWVFEPLFTISGKLK